MHIRVRLYDAFVTLVLSYLKEYNARLACESVVHSLFYVGHDWQSISTDTLHVISRTSTR